MLGESLPAGSEHHTITDNVGDSEASTPQHHLFLLQDVIREEDSAQLFDNTAAVEIETEDFTVTGDPSTSTVLVHPVLETEVALTDQSMPDEFGFISKFVEVADDVSQGSRTPEMETL